MPKLLAGADLTWMQCMLHHGEVKKLPSLMLTGEEPQQLATAVVGGKRVLVAATDRRLLVLRKRSLGRMDVTSIPYASMDTTALNMGLVFGRLAIVAHGREHVLDKVPRNQCVALSDYLYLALFELGSV